MNAAAKKEPSQELATVSVSPSSPLAMLQAAAAAGISPEQIKEMLAVQREWEANEARKAFVLAMAEFKANPPEIVKKKLVSYPGKDGKPGTSYRHATLHQVTEAIVASLAQFGFSHRWNLEQLDGGIIVVTCILTHRLGHSESTPMRSLPDNSGGKNGIQAVASAVSYMERYTLLAATGLATKDMDDDGVGSELTPEQLEEQRKAEEAADAIHDKIKLAESLSELQKVKPEIVALDDPWKANLRSIYNARLHELTPPK